MPHRNRLVAVSTALVLLLALVGAPLSASASTSVAGIDMTMRYWGEEPIWSQDAGQDVAVFTALNSVDMLDANTGWAVGFVQNELPASDPKRPFVAHITGGGSTITTAAIPLSAVEFSGVSAVDSAHVWAVGTGATIEKWNGTSWTRSLPPPVSPRPSR